MEINSTLQILMVLGLSIVYGCGAYGQSEKKELLKLVGIGGISIIILNIFFTQCPGAAVGQMFQLTAVVLISQLLVWLYFKVTNRENRSTDEVS